MNVASKFDFRWQKNVVTGKTEWIGVPVIGVKKKESFMEWIAKASTELERENYFEYVPLSA